jgi:carboxymethylenebutenolidase
MPTTTIDLETKTGACRTEIHTPEGAGPWPAVIVCFDAFGVRPSISAIAERISKMGYVVAVPDFYHNAGSVYELLPPGASHDVKGLMGLFSDQELRAKWSAKFYAPALDYDHLKNDVEPLLEVFAKRSDVKGGIGTTGYCMGGNMSLRIATIFGDKITATASIHGGGLATPAPDSVHLRATSIKSRVYIAGAIEDGSFTDDMKRTLDEALTLAHVDHTIETYPAKHGFAVSDHGVYDAAAAERHYMALEKFYGETLGK